MQFAELPEETKIYLAPFFDPMAHTSFAKLMPGNYPRILMEMASQAHEYLPLLDEEPALLKLLKEKQHYVPTVNDQRIRYLFWHEYENAMLDNRQMIMNNVHSLVCSDVIFKKLFLKTPYRAAYLLCRPAAYQQTLREMLLHGMGRMCQILDLPEIDERGELNIKVLELKLKITAMVDMRIHGAPTQKIHQVTQAIGLGGQGTAQAKQDVKTLVQKGDLRTIQERIKELEAEKRQLEGREGSPVPTGEAPEKPAISPEILEAVLVPAKKHD